MRIPAAVFAAVLTLAGGNAAARAALPAHVDLRASRIELYLTDPNVLAASGAVAATFGPRTLRADALRYDLQHNRVVASGSVVLSSGGTSVAAAACSIDLATGDGTLLRLDGAMPTTFTFTNDDVAHAEPAPPKPGTFDTLDTGRLRPFVRSAHAVVTTNANVRFTGARVLTETGAALPSPSYLYAFASNPSFSQQSMPVASFDQPYGLFGGPNSLLAAHFRYDTTTGRPTIGFDEHLVEGTRAYIVASVLPFISGGRVDLNGYQQLTPTLGQQLSASHGAGFDFALYQLQHSERATTTTVSLVQNGGFESSDLRLSTLTHEIPHLVSYKFAVDLGADREAGMLPYSSDARTTLEGYFATPNVRGPFGTAISSSLDLVTTLFDFPRERGSSTFYTSISRRLSPGLSLFGSVQFLQTFDRYRYGQSTFYPPTAPRLSDGSVYYGYGAYAGLATYRTYTLQATYSPNPSLNVVLTATHNRDFPQFDGYGNPPMAVGFDLRLRAPRGPSVEFGRTYVFGWGDQRWAPYYTLSVAP
jgi:hypothetical protein